MKKKTYIQIITVILFCVSGILTASTTDIWMVASADDFARGKMENVTILSTGQLAPGMGTTRLEIEEISIWSAAMGADGVSYIGTGNNGVVYRIKGNKVQKAFETGEAVVTSLVWGEDTLYAGTIPGGRIYAWKQGTEPKLVADLVRNSRRLLKLAPSSPWASILCRTLSHSVMSMSATVSPGLSSPNFLSIPSLLFKTICRKSVSIPVNCLRVLSLVAVAVPARTASICCCPPPRRPPMESHLCKRVSACVKASAPERAI